MSIQTNTFEIPVFEQRPETYLGEHKASADKDVFQFLLQHMHADHASAPKRFLDVGCATGDLLAFIHRYFPQAQLYGVDIDARLIEVAQARKDVCAQWMVADGLTERVGQFDVVTSLGTLGIFDRFEPLLENLVANTAPGGFIYVQALINPDDIDVRIAYRDNLNKLDWMRGFNIFSRTQIASWACNKGLEVHFFDFYMQASLPKRTHLPHRAYTVDMADGTRRTTNGLCLLLPETLMTLHVPH